MIYSYKKGSVSAKELAIALGTKQIKLEGSKFKGAPHKVVINWGNSTLSDEVAKCNVINRDTSIATNKLKFFNAIADYNDTQLDDAKINIPEFGTDLAFARSVLLNNERLYVRHLLTGHSGEGITILDNIGVIPLAPLYVQGIRKDQEYRVHVSTFSDEVFVQRKASKQGHERDPLDWLIRNHDNGFVFVSEPDAVGELPEGMVEMCKQVLGAVGLDFGAIDVTTERKTGKVVVLEANTACGLAPRTLEYYTKIFKGE